MNELWMIPLLNRLGAEAKEKLLTLEKISHQGAPDLVVMILEGGILDAWEGYRRNPKHRKEIEDFERYGINAPSGIFKSDDRGKKAEAM